LKKVGGAWPPSSYGGAAPWSLCIFKFLYPTFKFYMGIIKLFCIYLYLLVSNIVYVSWQLLSLDSSWGWVTSRSRSSKCCPLSQLLRRRIKCLHCSGELQPQGKHCVRTITVGLQQLLRCNLLRECNVNVLRNDECTRVIIICPQGILHWHCLAVVIESVFVGSAHLKTNTYM